MTPHPFQFRFRHSKKLCDRKLVPVLAVLAFVLAAFLASPTGELFAQDLAEQEKQEEQATVSSESSVESQTKKLERITVSGGADSVEKVAGSAQFLDQKDLEENQGAYGDINRILRQVPGVNITEEEGFGLRPNIGFRGTSTERSSKITLMEDGVLIAPAPYSAPSAYYFPTTGRMESIEVIKGSGQIKYGPYTTGGSLNLFSTSIPDQMRFMADLKTGSNDTRIGHVHLGDSYSNAGWLLETYQAESDGFKELDGGGDTGFELEDYLGKFRLNTDRSAENYQELELKLQTSSQDANETYLGLTDGDFDQNPFRRYRGSQLDYLNVDHDQVALTHYGEFGDNFDLTTTGYYNETRRNWFKLENVGGQSTANILSNPDEFAEELSWIQGADSTEGTFALRNNNRSYKSRGVQSVLGYALKTGELEHQFEFGARYHEDYEDRFQRDDIYSMLNGSLVLDSLGAPGSNANRKGEAEAWAFFLQDELSFGDWILTPGLRYETIDYTRRDWGKEDPGRSGANLAVSETSVDALIPGLGAYYQANEEVALFAGVHKGFSPPGPSSSGEVDEEKSINYEAGMNYNTGSFGSELVLFYNDYDNLLGADTLSSGGAGTGDLFNGGAATTQGVEASFGYDFASLLETAFALPFRATYTYTDAQFDSSFDSELFGSVTDGDSIPYIPENQFALNLAAEWDLLRLSLGGHYVDAMNTVAGASGLRSSDKTDSYFVTDASIEYKIQESLKLYLMGNNLFDEEYVVARRPAGARPGLPQTFMAGVRVNL